MMVCNPSSPSVDSSKSMRSPVPPWPPLLFPAKKVGKGLLVDRKWPRTGIARDCAVDGPGGSNKEVDGSWEAVWPSVVGGLVFEGLLPLWVKRDTHVGAIIPTRGSRHNIGARKTLQEAWTRQFEAGDLLLTSNITDSLSSVLIWHSPERLANSENHQRMRGAGPMTF